MARAQLKWPICAYVAFTSVLLGSVVLQTASGVHVLPVATPSLLVGTIPLAIGIAILRYRLFDVDLLINRALVYGALVAAIVGIYVLVVGYLGLLGPDIARRLVHFFGQPRPAAPEFPELSEREREVLAHIAQGWNNAAIAERLVLSPKTVRIHISNIFSKLQVADRAEAIVRARQAGLGQ